MAGSEKFGPEHASADLYQDAITFVETKTVHSDEAHSRIQQLWEAVGSTVVLIDPAIHDRWVARTSHVPHIAASALAQLITNPAEAAPFIGNGFRDTTRVAEGRPEIWRDICLTNPVGIAEGLRDLIKQLEFVAEAVEQQDSDALDDFFERGVQARQESLDS